MNRPMYKRIIPQALAWAGLVALSGALALAQGATLYCTAQPCNMCAKMIVNAGIVKVVIGGEYPDEFALEVLNAAGVELVYKPVSPKP